MDQKMCAYCRTYKPVSDLHYELKGRPGARAKPAMCTSCKEVREKKLPTAKRDAYGKSVTRNNSLEQSRFMKQVRSQ